MGNGLNNFAFIDGNNLNLSTINRGWRVDYRKFRTYLKDKYAVKTAFYFIGFIEGNLVLYSLLEKYGYRLIYKEVSRDADDNIKGNVDAELVLQAMIEFMNYDKAIIVTSDGDFACLVKYLMGQNKLLRVLAPARANCSRLLRKTAGVKIDFLDDLKDKLHYNNKEKPLKDVL
jgi:uncharacterized LabA/DUF88 family protein